MMVSNRWWLLTVSLLTAGGCESPSPQSPLTHNRERRQQAAALTFATSRISQADIDAGKFTASQLNDIGDFLFNHVFTVDEGMGNNLAGIAGSPAGPNPRPNLRQVHNGKFGGPDGADETGTGTCQSCHFSGGEDTGGDLAHTLLQDGDGLNPANALHRNGRSLLGDGYIQQLGIEMTKDLQAQVATEQQLAKVQGFDTQNTLVSKGINFGTIIAHVDGTLDTSGVIGVDPDFIVKPHGWKGRVAALRRFVEGGFQVHFGMQTEVLTTNNCKKANPAVVGNGPNCADPDNDGVLSEITEGQLTAMAIYAELRQAPIRLNPTSATALARVKNGEALLGSIGCTSCHTPTLKLNSPIHSEAPDLTGGTPLTFDLTVDVEDPKLAKNPDGSVTVELFSDLKRHDMGQSLADPHPSFGVIAPQLFITPPLWGIQTSPPYMHDGRSPTLQAAIVAHDGEATSSRINFTQLSADSQLQIVEFLQTLTRAPDQAGTDGGVDGSTGNSCTHPLCSTGGTLTASCDPCAQKICAADSFCCNTNWDSTCVGEVKSICNLSICAKTDGGVKSTDGGVGPVDLGTGGGTCTHPICSATGGSLTSGCDPCVTKVCASDSFCCDTDWDSICVGEVSSICKLTCK